MSEPSISVVMVSYHTGPVLEFAIEHTLADPNVKQLILVDNGNHTKVVRRLKDMAKDDECIELLTGHGNIGFAKACNLGARKADSEYLVLLNPDCLPEKQALTRLANALEDCKDAMLTGALVLNPDGTEQRACRRELLSVETAITESFRLDRFFALKRINQHHTALPEKPTAIPAISGACMCIRTQDYFALEGLDEAYFLHVEDLDFCARVAQAGGKIYFVPNAHVVHLLSTSETTSAFLEWHKARGFCYYFKKQNEKTSPTWKRYLLNFGIYLRMLAKVALSYVKRHPAPTSISAAGKKILLLLATYKLRPPHSAAKDKKFIVTGASSPVGVLLIGRLLASGAHVIAISRKKPLPLTIDRLQWMQADMNDPTFALPKGADGLFHCAPVWVLPPALQAISEAGIKRIIAFSSTSIFGKYNSENKGEQKVVKQLKDAEQAIGKTCPQLNIDYTILRPTMIYGTGLDGNVSRIARIIQRWYFFPVLPPAKGLRQPVHADDLAEAAIQAYSNDESVNMIYNLSGGETLSYHSMLVRIYHALGRTPMLMPVLILPHIFATLGFLSRKSHVTADMAKRMNKDLVFSHEDASLDFGYTPHNFLPNGLADIKGEVV